MFTTTLPLTEENLIDAVVTMPERPRRLVVADRKTELVARRIVSPLLVPPDWRPAPPAVEGFDAVVVDRDLAPGSWGLQ